MNDKPEEDEMVEYDSDIGGDHPAAPSKAKPPVK